METCFQYELEVLSTLAKNVQRLQDKIIRCDSTDYIMIDRFSKQCKSEQDVIDRKINELAMNEMWQMPFEDRVKKNENICTVNSSLGTTYYSKRKCN